MIIDNVDAEYLDSESTKELMAEYEKEGKRKVLVVPSGVPFDDLEDFTNKRGRFILKEVAETNFGFRQVIPYSIVMNYRNKKILTYLKNKDSNEDRLHGFWSIGVGGHVEPFDGTGWNAVENAMKREMNEEIGITPQKTVGEIYIRLDDTEVDRVHLAVARIVKGWQGKFKPSREIPDWEWCTVEQLKERNLETWSEFALNWLLREWGDLLGITKKDPAFTGK